MEVKLTTRYNFTYSFLAWAISLEELARNIDIKGFSSSNNEREAYIGYVSASILQSVAALESEIYSIYNYWPGHHLWTNWIDQRWAELLSIVSSSIEKENIINKYDIALQLVRSRKLNLWSSVMQDLKLLIQLRNEITHYKSLWTNEMENKNLFTELKNKDSSVPSFYEGLDYNFFPLICLSYKRAAWWYNTVLRFFEYYFKELDIISPIDDWRLSDLKSLCKN